MLHRSLYGLWRLELEYVTVDNSPAFELASANKIADLIGLQGNFPANRLTSRKIGPNTVVLRVPVLETDFVNFLIELELASFKLFYFEELE